MVELISVRNIIVHNRARIDERYLRSVPTSSFKLGEIRKLEVDDLFKVLYVLNEIVSDTDQQIAPKFGISTTLYGKESATASDKENSN